MVFYDQFKIGVVLVDCRLSGGFIAIVHTMDSIGLIRLTRGGELREPLSVAGLTSDGFGSLR